MGVNTGLQFAMGAIRSRREKHAKAYEYSDIVREVRSKLAESEDGFTEQDFNKVEERRKEIKKGRIKYAITGAVAGAGLAETASLAKKFFLGRFGGSQIESTSPKQGTSPLVPDQKGVVPSTVPGTTGNGGIQPHPGETAYPHYDHTGVPGEESPSHAGGVPSGVETPTSPYDHTGIPGEEAPTHLPGVEHANVLHGSENTTDEIRFAGGKDPFHQALTHENGGSKFINAITKGLEGKGQLDPAERDKLTTEWIAKLKSEGTLTSTGSLAHGHENYFDNFNPLKESHVVLDQIHSGTSYVDQLAQMGTTGVTETATGATEHLTGGLHNSAVTITETTQNSVLGGTASSEHTNQVGSSVVSGHTAPHIPNSTIPVEHSAPIPSTTEPSNSIPSSIPESQTIPGVTDLGINDTRFAFESSSALDPKNLENILDPRNGYISRELSTTLHQMLDNHQLKPEDFRLSNTPGHVGTDIKIHLHEAGRPEFIGHQLQHQFKVEAPVNGVDRSWFEKLFGLNKPKPETIAPNPITPNAEVKPENNPISATVESAPPPSANPVDATQPDVVQNLQSQAGSTGATEVTPGSGPEVKP